VICLLTVGVGGGSHRVLQTVAHSRALKEHEVGGQAKSMGVRRGEYKVLIGEPQGKKPLGGASLRLE
jgi:hypothetical protein